MRWQYKKWMESLLLPWDIEAIDIFLLTFFLLPFIPWARASKFINYEKLIFASFSLLPLIVAAEIKSPAAIQSPSSLQ